MKILNASQIKEVDIITADEEMITSLDLMERASNRLFKWFIINYPDRNINITIVSGSGGNGGDGLALARYLLNDGYNVKTYILNDSVGRNNDCATNLSRLKQINANIVEIVDEEPYLNFEGNDIIVDALFGIGLTRPVSGIYSKIIERINKADKKVISIDIPSGLFIDKKSPVAIKADKTITFQIPKKALFLPDNDKYVGELHTIDIGLSRTAIEKMESDESYFTIEDASLLLKPLNTFTHKGEQGHVVVIGGSKGKIGAVCLATKASLCSGCGMVTAYTPKCGAEIVHNSLLEAMSITDDSKTKITNINIPFSPDVVAIGIGMGTSRKSGTALRTFLLRHKKPMVIDADALNIISKNKDLLSHIPKDSILTPHPKELSRLIGTWEDDFEKIEKTKALSKKYGITIVIKGKNSIIVSGEKISINSSGNPALATAGSGDVLTGIIAGLIAQNYLPYDAARLGVYIHGLSADIAIEQEHINPRNFIASNIIDSLGRAFNRIERITNAYKNHI